MDWMCSSWGLWNEFEVIRSPTASSVVEASATKVAVLLILVLGIIIALVKALLLLILVVVLDGVLEKHATQYSGTTCGHPLSSLSH
jgi:hypothetical protein